MTTGGAGGGGRDTRGRRLPLGQGGAIAAGHEVAPPGQGQRDSGAAEEVSPRNAQRFAARGFLAH